jgi:hypothetical protein
MDIVGKLNFVDGERIEVILCLENVECFRPRYDEFISSIFPVHLSIDVSVKPTIQIEFKANNSGQILFTHALKNSSTLYTIYDGMMQNEYDNIFELEVRKYVKWTDIEYEQRILLLEVDDNLDLHHNDFRYDVDGMNLGYNRGDRHSWQRYTKSLPIECAIDTSSLFDDLPHVVILEPVNPLKYNTQYAILLMNNVPIVPLKYPRHDIDFYSEGIGEDKLFMFHTEKRKF